MWLAEKEAYLGLARTTGIYWWSFDDRGILPTGVASV
jgi:hypothetical protein